MKLFAARVFVESIVDAKPFYETMLGLPLVQDGTTHGYCVFDLGGPSLIVEQVRLDASAEDGALVGRFTALSFSVPDIEAEYARLSSAGVSFSGAPEHQFWGGILATFRDPSGNELQLVQLNA